MRHRIARLTIPSLGFALVAILVSLAVARAGQQTTSQSPSSIVGQSATRLPDGRWLVVGGIGPDGPIKAVVTVERAGGTDTTARVEAALNDARGWHSATMLPDGRVLIAGGVGQNGKVTESAEVFDPQHGTLQMMPWLGTGRAHHTSTLLRDGRVLIAGGLGSDRTAIQTVELFDPTTLEVRALEGNLLSPRQDHMATLLPNGSVRFDVSSSSISGARSQEDESEIYNPALEVSRRAERAEREYDVATLAFTSPANDEEVSGDSRIALQFTKPLAVQSLQNAVIGLQDEDGTPANVRTVLAEGGRLLFLTPEHPLTPGQRYHATVSKLFDTTASGRPTLH